MPPKQMAITLLCIAATVAGVCGCDRGAHETRQASKREAERRRLCQDYETAHAILHNKYGYFLTRPDISQWMVDWYAVETNSYAKLVEWRLSEVADETGKTFINGEIRWLESRIEMLQSKNRMEEIEGNEIVYGLGDFCLFYSMANRRLLLSPEDEQRWNRIKNAFGTIKGEPFQFDNGDAHIVLPWRIFEPKPFHEHNKWWAFIQDHSALSFQGKDYVLVRFASETGIDGCPTTTEESVLVEIQDGRVERYVGLHNMLFKESQCPVLDKNLGLAIFEAFDSFPAVKYVVDLRSMKIISSKSVLSRDFVADGYAELFADEAVR